MANRWTELTRGANRAHPVGCDTNMWAKEGFIKRWTMSLYPPNWSGGGVGNLMLAFGETGGG